MKLVAKRGWKEVLARFSGSRTLAIVTFNIDDAAINVLKKMLGDNARCKLTIVTNIPSRGKWYTKERRDRAKEEIGRYLSLLGAELLPLTPSVYFCFTNHAKIVISDTLAYVGSANFSVPESDNFEAGVILREASSLSDIRSFLDEILSKSIHYYSIRTVPALSNLFEFAIECPLVADELHWSCYEIVQGYKESETEEFVWPQTPIDTLVSSFVEGGKKLFENVVTCADSLGLEIDLSSAESYFDQFSEALQELKEIDADEIREESLAMSLVEELLGISPDGKSQDVYDSPIYQERMQDAMDKNAKELYTRRKYSVDTLVEIIRDLGAAILEDLREVGPSSDIDNTQRQR